MSKKEKIGTIEIMNMRDVISTQLKQTYSDIELGAFGDKSASWIDIKERVENKLITTTISFDYDGNTMTDIKVFISDIKEVEENQRSLKSTLR